MNATKNYLSKTHDEMKRELAARYHWYRSPFTRAELLTEHPSDDLVSRAVDFCTACAWNPKLCRSELNLIARWQSELSTKTYEAALRQAVGEWIETETDYNDAAIIKRAEQLCLQQNIPPPTFDCWIDCDECDAMQMGRSDDETCSVCGSKKISVCVKLNGGWNEN